MRLPPNPAISAISTFLPEEILTNQDLVAGKENWTEEKIFSKTGIRSRRVADSQQTASEMASTAAEQLFTEQSISPENIDLVVFCTKSPDYLLPTSACMLQERLGIKRSAAAFDFNLGCSGYVYGLAICQSMMQTHELKSALLLTGDTYTHFISPEVMSTRTIFGDGASATLLQGCDDASPRIGSFIFGTDGTGFEKLVVPKSGCSNHVPEGTTPGQLHMSGAEVFTFTLAEVPAALEQLLAKSNNTREDIDWFVFHQANAFMLSHLRRRCRIPAEKFVIDVEETGNTVSTSIPLALQRMAHRGDLQRWQRLALLGFGVGFSWAGCIITW